MEKIYVCAIIAWVTFMSLYIIYHILLRIEDHSNRKSEQRRAAGRPKAYAEVRKRREIESNRRELWHYLNK